jgi:RNA polymerase sigma factor (sigma-70 family)
MFPDTPKTLLQKIADRTQRNDCAEWAAFVELYAPPLMRFVRLQSPGMSEADAEDVVQDVFIRLVDVLRERKIDRNRAKFRAYLASMTRHLLIDRYRAAQARPALAAGPVPNATFIKMNTPAGPVPSGSAGPVPIAAIDPGVAVDVLWRQAAREAAKEHIFTKTAVSAQSKRIYELLERGLSPREVAAQVGVSRDVVKQVKSRIDRAIAAIEEAYT